MAPRIGGKYFEGLPTLLQPIRMSIVSATVNITIHDPWSVCIEKDVQSSKSLTEYNDGKEHAMIMVI